MHKVEDCMADFDNFEMDKAVDSNCWCRAEVADMDMKTKDSDSLVEVEGKDCSLDLSMDLKDSKCWAGRLADLVRSSHSYRSY